MCIIFVYLQTTYKVNKNKFYVKKNHHKNMKEKNDLNK